MRVTPLSAISWLEVLQGMRNKAELVVVKKMLQHRAATLLPVSEAMTQRAIDLMESLTWPHAVKTPIRVRYIGPRGPLAGDT
ncbi:MAG TPA: hypothetical protein PLL04_03035 [Thauera sp.]|nr:hypothetical protein [Thauera sp.]